MEHGGTGDIGAEKQLEKRSGHGDKKNNDARNDSARTIGTYLRDKRMNRDIGLEEVSAATGISSTVLRALENDDRDKLPAEVYVKAFYRKYAEYLDVDFEELQAKYQQQAQNLKKTRRRFDFSTVITLRGQGGNIVTETFRRLLLPIVILLFGFLLYWIYNNYLAPNNPLGFYLEQIPAFYSSMSSKAPDLFC
ncbi:MAG: helix-turn-helix domain-containing protein [Desulfobulbales bacterium]